MDDYSREMVGQLVDFSVTGAQVARFLNQLAEQGASAGQLAPTDEPGLCPEQMPAAVAAVLGVNL